MGRLYNVDRIARTQESRMARGNPAGTSGASVIASAGSACRVTGLKHYETMTLVSLRSASHVAFAALAITLAAQIRRNSLLPCYADCGSQAPEHRSARGKPVRASGASVIASAGSACRVTGLKHYETMTLVSLRSASHVAFATLAITLAAQIRRNSLLPCCAELWFTGTTTPLGKR
jgi:hypothetical protein